MTAATLTAGDLESVRYDFNSYWVMTRGYLVLTNKIMQNYRTALKISLPFIGRVLFWWKKHALFFYIYVKFTIVPLDYHCKTPVSLNSLEKKTRHTHPRTQLRGSILKIALVNRFFRKTGSEKLAKKNVNGRDAIRVLSVAEFRRFTLQCAAIALAE